MKSLCAALWAVGFTLIGCSDDSTGASGGSGGSGATSNAGGNGGSPASVGGSTSNAPDTSSTGGTTTTTDATTSTATGVMDPYAAQRQACIDKINSLRASIGKPPYARWTDAETCVDQQATADEMSNSPHGAWISGTYPCNGGGQNECLGAGPGGIEGCLDSMWSEKDQAGCSGCDACADAYDPNCPNCDFYGQATGDVCGHYVNMSANYFSMAACGFSSLGGWDAINFQ